MANGPQTDSILPGSSISQSAVEENSQTVSLDPKITTEASSNVGLSQHLDRTPINRIASPRTEVAPALLENADQIAQVST
jgi:hypothetical protein